MEGYAEEERVADGLAVAGEAAAPPAEAVAALLAAAEAVAPGSGPSAVAVALLVGRAGRLVTLDECEQQVVEGVRQIGLGVVQVVLDRQADAEERLAGVMGADGYWRGWREDSSVPVVTMLGRVRVRRVAYRSRVKGRGCAVPAGCGAEPAAVRVLVAAAAGVRDAVPVRVVPGRA